MASTNGHTAPNGASPSIDPITLRVLNGAFTAAAKEMAHVLYRMSYSSIIRESEDLGAGLYDAEGNEICESDTSPMHVGSLPAYIRGFLKRLKGKINDGDVILHNHPYLGASHTPDLGIAVPVFWQGELIGFAAATAHLLDMGGAAPGLNVDVVDVWAERAPTAIGTTVQVTPATGEPWSGTTDGLAEDGAKYLADRAVVLVALDNPFTDPVAEGQLAQEAMPPQGMDRGLPFIIHHQNLANAGIHQIQNAKLDTLAADKVYTSCTMVLPLRSRGHAGSPVRPVAVGAPAT